MVGFIASKSLRAIQGNSDFTSESSTKKLVVPASEPGPVKQTLLVTRYDTERAEKEESLRLMDITELLGLPLIGVIPESRSVLTSANMGSPVVAGTDDAAVAYQDVVRRILGEEVEMKFIKSVPKSFLQRLFGSK